MAKDLTVLEKLQLGVFASLAQQPPAPQLDSATSQSDQAQQHSPGLSVGEAALPWPTTMVGHLRTIDRSFGLEEFSHFTKEDREALELNKPMILPPIAQRKHDETSYEELLDHHKTQEDFA